MEITDNEIGLSAYIGNKTNTFPLMVFNRRDHIVVVVENEKAKILGKKGEKIKSLENHLKKHIKVIDISNNTHDIISTLFNKSDIYKIEEDDKNNKIFLYLKINKNNYKLKSNIFVLKNIFNQFLNKSLIIKFVGGKYGKR